VSDGQAAVLSAAQREVHGQALADALSYRTPDGGCTGCDEDPPGCATTTPRSWTRPTPTWRSLASSGPGWAGARAMEPEGDDGMSDERVREMTDDQVRGLADAVGTWKPDAYYQPAGDRERREGAGQGADHAEGMAGCQQRHHVRGAAGGHQDRSDAGERGAAGG
jgi:hypothetical protein